MRIKLLDPAMAEVAKDVRIPSARLGVTPDVDKILRESEDRKARRRLEKQKLALLGELTCRSDCASLRIFLLRQVFEAHDG